MKTILVTGGIGSGKSAVCRYLESKGIPVYDSDSRTKSLYDTVPSLLESVNQTFGGKLLDESGKLDRKALATLVFSDPVKLKQLESLVHPAVLEDFTNWRNSYVGKVPFVVMESAIALNLNEFVPEFDFVLLVDAPLELRIDRAVSRDGCSREAVAERIERQSIQRSRADIVINNDSSIEELMERTEAALEKMIIFAR